MEESAFYESMMEYYVECTCAGNDVTINAWKRVKKTNWKDFRVPAPLCHLKTFDAQYANFSVFANPAYVPVSTAHYMKVSWISQVSGGNIVKLWYG